MSLHPIFRARVTDAGKLQIMDRRSDYARLLQRLKGKIVDVTVRRHREKRSLAQNAWWWGVAIPLIADHLGYDQHEHDGLHYELVKIHWGVTYGGSQSGKTNLQLAEELRVLIHDAGHLDGVEALLTEAALRLTALPRANKRSSELETPEFSAMMEWIVRWAADEHGIVVPLPNEDFEVI